MPVKISKPIRLHTRGEQITEAVMTEILSVIDSHTTQYVPIDTAALINSRFRQVEKVAGGFIGRIGFTENYAAALHERTDWRPKLPNTDGKKGGGYNPDATHHFLARGVDESRADIKKLLVAKYGAI